MTLSVHVVVDTDERKHAQLVTEAALATLRDQGVAEGSLSIVLIHAEEMRQLNRQYAGNDHPTDVLAFPAGHPDPETGELELGDVVICHSIARQQAAATGYSLEEELTLLTVHGVLHLTGHDHAGGREKARMSEAQVRILAQLGYALDARLP